MLPIIATVMEWLPRIAVWILAPAAILLLVLAFSRAARSHCLLGFMVVASLSALLLLTGVVLIVGGYGNAVMHVFQSFGPIETIDFVATLFPSIASQLGNLVPVLATAAGAGLAAIVLRRQARASRPAAESAQ